MARRSLPAPSRPPRPVERSVERLVARAVVLTVVLAGAATGCAGRSPSALSPEGPRSQDVATSWWILFGIAAGVCVLVIGAAVLAVVFRRRARKVSATEGRGPVLVLGVVLPSLVFAGTFAMSVVDLRRSSEPSSSTPTVTVIGHKWWWEVRYGGTSAVTANEIHVPVGTPVQLELESADVIHSFWVPQLIPKTDLVPGMVNQTWLTADREGRYRGQCAEYCGVQHAHMAFVVVAEPASKFQSWLEDQQADAATPADALASRGETVLTQGTCASCHTVRGTSADGKVGPDLTHLASRSYLAAGAIPNDRGHLAGWIANSQTIKPGNRMPPQPLAPEDLLAVVAYLEGLS